MKEVDEKFSSLVEKVSNPWREAIEAPEPATIFKTFRLVSNPWREAIEVVEKGNKVFIFKSFQSLEGGY